MSIVGVVLFVLIALLLWVNLRATRRLLRSDLDGMRRPLFIAGVWLMPFFGALAVKDVAAGLGATVAEPQPPLAAVDWPALAGWAAAAPPQGATPEATDQARHAWLQHLVQALGPHFALHESADALLVTSLDRREARALLGAVATTRRRITRLLDGLAQFEHGARSIVVVLDDEDDYYQYVGIYYPDEGEFAFSGGMFVDAGCPHFVARRSDLPTIEPVIAHELTHAALAHLRLPRWLDEGIAVSTETRLTGHRAGPHDAQQLDAMHRAYWTAATIQTFWSGESFFRTDEGNELSYALARILVEQASRDWARFIRFVRETDRADAGRSAAAAVLGLDLGAWVRALFDGEGDWGPAPGEPGPALAAA